MRIVGPQASLDVSHRHADAESGERAAQRTRRVALYDKQVGPNPEQRQQGRCDLADMGVGVVFAGHVETHGIEPAETKLGRVKAWVLSGKHERRPAAAGGYRMCYRCHLDCFRSGTDHQPDIG
ncbi:hypothetical protein GCM10022276_12950 [Sphingomonas limnosediminicola]|uniref:Uncharacterized protein n=1 Tax=Sphingomonas limnosediminicola TaxID=940133 RepID=A0ABP7L747_9SPHN